ncbi:MAG TPA: hypothetical protein VEH31_43850 [Streptosporangiaceae bacterium]|nr:hypothetical protein [Streptosporangiaceae bacterium]
MATNLYCEKNNVGSLSASTVTTSQIAGGGQINAGQYLRGVRLVVRTQSAGGTTAAQSAVNDWPWNLLTQTDFVNVDGSEILYVMGGYAHYLAQKYTRPWLGDPAMYPDAAFASSVSPQFTLFLQPEIRWTAGCLANTDTRSQYRIDFSLDTLANIVGANGGSYSSGPVVSVQPYVDAWAQPDAEDLQGVPNQPVPPGLNLQMKRRHQIFTLNSSSDNILQSALTGNALRCQILVTRNGGTSRVETLTDPIQWQLDNRSLGKISVNPENTLTTTGSQGGDMVQNWMYEQYSPFFTTQSTVPTTGASGGTHTTTAFREAGVMVFPRFLNPGSLYGQGWLYTANSTKEIFESTAGSLTSGTAELITDEVYPVGPVDPQLTDI